MWPSIAISLLQDTGWDIPIGIATVTTGICAILAVFFAYRLNNRKEKQIVKNSMALTNHILVDYTEILMMLLRALVNKTLKETTYLRIKSLFLILCDRYDQISVIIISGYTGDSFSDIDRIFRDARMHFVNDRFDFNHFIQPKVNSIDEVKRLIKKNYNVLLKIDKKSSIPHSSP